VYSGGNSPVFERILLLPSKGYDPENGGSWFFQKLARFYWAT
jgi:hypothetical protein